LQCDVKSLKEQLDEKIRELELLSQQMASIRIKEEVGGDGVKVPEIVVSAVAKFIVVCADLSASNSFFEEIQALYQAMLAALRERSPDAILAVVTHGHSPRGTVNVTAAPASVTSTTDAESQNKALVLTGDGEGCSSESYRTALPEIVTMIQKSAGNIKDCRVVLVGDGEVDCADVALIDGLDGKVPIHSIMFGTRKEHEQLGSMRTFSRITGGTCVNVESGIPEEFAKAIEASLF